MMFAGDAHATLRKVGMKDGSSKPGDWFFSKERGDGTVPSWSAARRDDQGGYGNSLPSFAEHGTIFDDKWVLSKIARSLFETSPSDPDPIKGPGRPSIAVTIDGFRTDWSVETAEVNVSDSVVTDGTSVTANLAIKMEPTSANVLEHVYLPKAELISETGTRTIEVIDVTTAEDLANKTLRYTTTASAPVGVHRIVFRVDGGFSPRQAFEVIER